MKLTPSLAFALCLAGATAVHAAAPATVDPLAQKRADLKALNDRIESRVGHAVDILSGVTDSPESRLIVSHVKGDAIKGMKSNLDALRSKREMLRDQALRYGGGAADELQAEVARLDIRIGERIDQLIRLASSLDKPEEIERYQARYDDWDISYRENDAWRQNKVSTTFSSGERKEIVNGLRTAITRLESERKRVQGYIAAARSPQQKALFETDAARIDGLLAQRQAQLESALTTSGPRRALNQASANELRKLFNELRKDLSADTRSLMRKYSDYVSAVTAAAR